MKKRILPAIIFLSVCNLSFAQLEDRFNHLSTDNLVKYVQPLITSIGTSLNSGSYYSASTSKIFGFSIGVHAMMMFIPSDQTSYTPSLPEGYTADKSTATIYGDKGSYYAGKNGYATYPPGINQKVIPMGVPQVAVSALGTELMLRYLPPLKFGERNFKFFGFGVKHSVSQYLFVSPVDVAVQFLYTEFSLTDLITSTNTAFNVHASKSFGVVILYGGFQFEKSSCDVKYTIKGDAYSPDPNLKVTKSVKATIDGLNKSRITIGTAFKLGVLVLNADYSLSSQSILTGGLSLAF